MDKKKTAKRGQAANESKFEKSNLNNNSLANQRNRLLQALQKSPVSTFMARHKLNICHPGGRVCELRQQGYRIVTHRRLATTPEGFAHRIAEYVLLPGNSKRRAAA